MSRRMLAVFSSNHHQRSGRNLADGHAIPGSGLLLTTWQTPTLGFWKQERQLRTGSAGGCLRSIAQRTRRGACSCWIGHCYSEWQYWCWCAVMSQESFRWAVARSEIVVDFVASLRSARCRQSSGQWLWKTSRRTPDWTASWRSPRTWLWS